jgi:uncharacterized repeat protein (TIGR01451 family)
MKNSTEFVSWALWIAFAAGCAHTPSKSVSSVDVARPADSSPSLPSPGTSRPVEKAAIVVPAGKSADTVPYARGVTIYYPTGSREGAALAIDKLVPEDVDAGALFDYQIVVSNVCSSALEDVLVKETFDENFSFKGARPAGNPGPGRMMAFDLGSMQPGQAKTITITGSAAKPGSIASCATLEYRIPSCATIRVSAPGLHVMTTMASDAILCDTIKGKITVSNPGSSLTRKVRVTDALADGLTTTDGKSSIEIEVGDLKPNESRDYPFTLKAERTGRFQNVATATAEGNMARQSMSVDVTVRQPVLSLRIECPAGPMVVGRTGTYKFTVKNTGDAPAADAVLHVDIPTSMEFKSADNGGTVSGTKLTFQLGTLASNEIRNLTATYIQGPTPGVVTARAQLLASCAPEVRDWCETRAGELAGSSTGVQSDARTDPVPHTRTPK